MLAAVTNDWQLSGIYTGQSGDRYSLGYGYQGGIGNVNITGSPNYGGRVVLNGDLGSGCSGNQYAQFNTAVVGGPVPGSVGLESGQNYLTGCFENFMDLAIARNFPLGGSRNLQFRIDLFNAFNAVVYNAFAAQLQLNSPTDQTVRNPQFNADGTLVQTRLTPQNAGFGAATGAQAMRTAQLQLRFQF